MTSPTQSSAIQITISNPVVQKYLQRYPFATGPIRELNDAGRRLIAQGIGVRPAAPAFAPKMLDEGVTKLTTDERARVDNFFLEFQLSVEQCTKHLDDFEWEANLVPRNAKSVLVVGCGDGIELIFLRAVLPDATITAIDYCNKLINGLKNKLVLTFHEGDVTNLLPKLQRQYDLIFSNHTMEHFYEPDATLQTLGGLLLVGGHIISVMPMVGMKGTPFLSNARKILERLTADQSCAVHPLELIYLDPGHPWKTNPDDIAFTLSRAGFTDVAIYQREHHLSRPLHLSYGSYRAYRALMVTLNRIIIGIPRRLAMALFPQRVPSRLPKLFFALERRLPFGTNYVTNIFSQEALFIAQRADKNGTIGNAGIDEGTAISMTTASHGSGKISLARPKTEREQSTEERATDL